MASGRGEKTQTMKSSAASSSEHESRRKAGGRFARKLTEAVAFLALVISSLSYIRLKFITLDVRVVAYGIKLVGGAFAPLVALVGLVSAALGLIVRAPLAVISGAVGAILSVRYVLRVAAPHDDFERAFGVNWQNRIPPEHSSRMLKRRWMWRQIPVLPEAHLEKDVVFWTIPGTSRELLCDIWQPAAGVERSKLALVYMHGGAWQSLDKDRYTRPFFQYLTAQGHVVMDVAYRLCHETDLYGIVGDVKRAIAWIKANATRFDVDPARIVAAGSSAGGHLALLAAYTPRHPQLDPADLCEADTSVRGVISFYGLPDLRQLGKEPGKSNAAFVMLGRNLGFVAPEGHYDFPDLARKLFGGLPEDVPEVAALMSPITRVGAHCPPTLLLQGTHDHITHLEDVRTLYKALMDVGVPVVYAELPQTEHAFDLLALKTSPPAQAALYDVERFLALML